MKKLFLLSMTCLLAFTIKAQRCAVLDFQVGNNITEEEVDGVTYAFRSNFQPTNYTILERMMINQVVSNFGYTRTDMTRQQMLRVGRELEASIIVIGTVNKFMDEYSVDIQVVNVGTGTTTATEGSTFLKTEYRTALQTTAQKLITRLGSQNNSSSGSNISKNVPDGYTDLGLPSGTIWKNFNATGLYTYDEAVSQFGSRLPSKAQWEELKAECQWQWTGSGYKVTGPNGNSIELPAEGYRLCDGRVNDGFGFYLSSAPYSSKYAWFLYFHSGIVEVSYTDRCYGYSVRLVQK